MPVRRLLPVLLVALALPLAACGGDSGGASGGAAKAPKPAGPTTTPASSAPPGCHPEQPRGERVAHPARPKGRLDPAKTYVAVVTTNCGSFEIRLAVKRAPRTSASFASLARQKFFDGLTFHRISRGFVIQGGDPSGDGTGGPGYSVEEAPPKDLAYSRGVVAMAKTSTEPAGTSGSQFFVVTAEETPLTPDYALLGRVTKGQDVVDAIGLLPTRADEQPVDPVVIDSVRIVAR